MIRVITAIAFTEEEMREVGRRICNVERLFNVREGAGRKDDYLHERHYTEPTPFGVEINPVVIINREKYDMMLDEY